MPFIDSYHYVTKPIVYKRMSLWRRFLWWLGPHFTIVNLVLFAFCFYMIWFIVDAARAGRLPVGW